MNKFCILLKNVCGFGVVKIGIEYFVMQCLIVIVLVGLIIWFLVFVLSLIGVDYVIVIEVVFKLWNVVLLVGFLVVMFWYVQFGLQVVLEDYIYNLLLVLVLQIMVKFIVVFGVIVSVFVVVCIVFGVV